MKKILTIVILTLSVYSVSAQNINFTNLYGNSASEPDQYHISNTNTGFGGDWGLDVKWWGGVKLRSSLGMLYLNKWGNVGIGTDAPTEKLDVRGSLRVNNGLEYSFISIGQQGNDNIIADNSSDKNYGGGYFFRVHNNNATDQYVDALMIDENGNIGIGSKPTAKLDVNGTFRVASNGNSFLYNGAADLVLKAPVRGSGGRAIVHDEANTLTLNYDGDFTGGTKIGSSTIIKNNGNAAFQGKLEAKEVKVTQTPTADFVFEESYDLPKLEDVEKHIKEKKHLPEIASAKEMEKEGVNVGDFQIKLLQKIEELTLYSIEQNKKLKNQSQEIERLQVQNKELKKEYMQIESLIQRIEQLEKQKN